MAFTEDEKASARHHLGYLQVTAAQTFVLGVPAAVQTQFMIEGALVRVLPSGEKKFRALLCRLDEIECEVFGGIDLASVESVDEIKVSADRLKELAKYYVWAQTSLANLLGVPPNPWDMRPLVQAAGAGGVNVGVNH